MYVANRREVNDLTALVNAIAGASREGASLHSLASQTGLPPQRVASLLSKHSDYFVRVGGREAFALNSFGKCKGSGEATLQDIARSYRRMRGLTTAGYAVGAVLALGGAAGVAWSMMAPAPALLAPSAVLLILGVLLLFAALKYSS